MIAENNEGIPPKDDTASIKKAPSTVSLTNKAVTPTEVTATAETAPKAAAPEAHMFRAHLQQQTKVLRDAWAHHTASFKLTAPNWPLLALTPLTIFGHACNVAALASSRWTCDLDVSHGLWDTCYQPITDGPIWPLSNHTQNDSVTSQPMPPIKCAKQGVRWVESVEATPSRIYKVYAAQVLLVFGAILYAFSLFTICLSYRFAKMNNVMAFRNSMFVSVCMQFVAFFSMLIGFYLFILTEQYSISVGLLFIYFGLAMFACNTINFFTVEYKTHKAQKARSPACE